MNGHELKVHEERSSHGRKILAGRKAPETADQVRDLLRIRWHVAPAAQSHTRRPPAAECRRVRNPSVYRWSEKRFIKVEDQSRIDRAMHP
jgi:hypothetical protein